MTEYLEPLRCSAAPSRRHCLAVAAVVLTGLLLAPPAAAQGKSSAKKSYDISVGDASRTLREFSDQSGEELLYSTEAIRGVKTNPIKGTLSSREALDSLL